MSDLHKDVNIDPEDVEALVSIGLEAGINDPEDMLRALRKLNNLGNSGDSESAFDEPYSTATFESDDSSEDQEPEVK
jgi:hypothetical protein